MFFTSFFAKNIYFSTFATVLQHITDTMELRVKQICKEKGILFKDLAAAVGVHDVTLRSSLQGNPTIGTLDKVAGALGVSVPELFAPQPTNTITCPHCGKLIKVEKGE